MYIVMIPMLPLCPGLPASQELNAMVLSARQVLLQWKPPAGIVSTGLTLLYKVEVRRQSIVINSVYTSDNSILLSLHPDYTYTSTVKTCYDRTRCGYSISGTHKMLEDGKILRSKSLIV